MKPEVVEISYTVQVWNCSQRPKAWAHYGQATTILGARKRQQELRSKFKRVRIMEHKRTATIVL